MGTIVGLAWIISITMALTGFIIDPYRTYGFIKGTDLELFLIIGGVIGIVISFVLLMLMFFGWWLIIIPSIIFGAIVSFIGICWLVR